MTNQVLIEKISNAVNIEPTDNTVKGGVVDVTVNQQIMTQFMSTRKFKEVTQVEVSHQTE